MISSEHRIDRRRLFADLDYEPHPGQWKVHESTAPRRVLACGVRWGKTRCAAMEAIVASLEPKEKSIGWIVAPTYDLCDRVFREIQVLVLEKIRHRVIQMKESERRLILRNLGGGVSEIRAKSADNPVSLLGEGLDFVIVDEAARLKPEIWMSHLTQRLIDKQGWALLISTPRGKGWFYDVFQRGRRGSDPAFESWNSPSWENPHLPREVVEAERARLPARVFDQEFGANFVEGSGAVFRNVRECATGTFEEPRYGERYRAGLDLAKTEDYTVLVIVKKSNRQVVYVDRFHRIDWAVAVNRVKAATDRYNKAWMWVDTTGLGEPIYESLNLARCRVSPYPFTAASKAALIHSLSILIEKRLVILPRPDVWPEGIEELENFQYAISERGNTRTSAPSGQHDDCVIATALALWDLKDQAPMMNVWPL